MSDKELRNLERLLRASPDDASIFELFISELMRSGAKVAVVNDAVDKFIISNGWAALGQDAHDFIEKIHDYGVIGGAFFTVKYPGSQLMPEVRVKYNPQFTQIVTSINHQRQFYTFGTINSISTLFPVINGPIKLSHVVSAVLYSLVNDNCHYYDIAEFKLGDFGDKIDGIKPALTVLPKQQLTSDEANNKLYSEMLNNSRVVKAGFQVNQKISQGIYQIFIPAWILDRTYAIEITTRSHFRPERLMWEEAWTHINWKKPSNVNNLRNLFYRNFKRWSATKPTAWHLNARLLPGGEYPQIL